MLRADGIIVTDLGWGRAFLRKDDVTSLLGTSKRGSLHSAPAPPRHPASSRHHLLKPPEFIVPTPPPRVAQRASYVSKSFKTARAPGKNDSLSLARRERARQSLCRKDNASSETSSQRPSLAPDKALLLKIQF